MKRIIETRKGMFLVVEAIDNASIHTGVKLSEITEEECKEIVDLYKFQHNSTKILYDLHEIGIRKWTTSAIQSLHSLLESHNIEITNNTYIFKV